MKQQPSAPGLPRNTEVKIIATGKVKGRVKFFPDHYKVEIWGKDFILPRQMLEKKLEVKDGRRDINT